MIRFKFIKSELTGTPFPRQDGSVSFTTDDLKNEVAKRHGPSAASIIDDALRILCEQIGSGKCVTLNEIGTFSIRLGIKAESAGKENPDTKDVQIKGVRLNASKSIMDRLGKCHLHHDKVTEVMSHKSLDDRWLLLYDHILQESERVGHSLVPITIKTYMAVCGATYYKAKQELKQLEEKGKLQRLPGKHVQQYIINPSLLKDS